MVDNSLERNSQSKSIGYNPQGISGNMQQYNNFEMEIVAKNVKVSDKKIVIVQKWLV